MAQILWQDRMEEAFEQVARYSCWQIGKARSFALSILLTLIWLISGPLCHWSDTWQLAANTFTTLFTWSAIFLLQNTQNRDTMAIQVKLDEIVHANRNASNLVMRVEDLTEEQMRLLRDRLQKRT